MIRSILGYILLIKNFKLLSVVTLLLLPVLIIGSKIIGTSLILLWFIILKTSLEDCIDGNKPITPF